MLSDEELKKYKHRMIKADYLDMGEIKSAKGVLVRFTNGSVWLNVNGTEIKSERGGLGILEVFDGVEWTKISTQLP